MPRNNTREARRAKFKVENLRVGEPPAVTKAPGQIVAKNLQDALIDGLKDPAQWSRDFLDCDPYEAQATFLRETRDCTEANFVAGNRVGKTWVSGVILLWRAFYRYISPYTAPPMRSPHTTYKAVATSLTHDQAKLSWTYAHTFATGSKRFKPFLVDTIHSPFPTMTLRTRDERGEWVISEVWSRSLAKGGVYLLGHSIGFLLVDECAYIKGYPQIEDEVLRMRLADQGGSLFRISTPNGRNFFYDYFLKGLPNEAGERDPRYFSMRISSWDNPYVSRAFLEEQKARMLPDFYAQNVLAEFVSLSDFFRLEVIQGLYRDQDYSLPVEPVRRGVYVLGADLGAQRDPTEVFVLRIDVEPAEIVYAGSLKNSSWRASREYVAGIYGKYQPARSFIDATGVGAPVVQQLIEEDGLQGVTPFVFSHSSKPDAMVRLQDAAQRRRFVFPFCNDTRELVNQLSFYRLDDREIVQDKVIALALANLAFEDYNKQGVMDSQIYDDLMVVPVTGGGRGVPADLVLGARDEFEGGLRFRVDPNTGIFIPVDW